MQSIDEKENMMREIENLAKNLDDELSKIPDEIITSDVCAANFLRLMGVHIQGVLYLANSDQFLQPALAISRTVIDIFGKLIWLIEPNKPDNRQIRFIALLEDEKNFILYFCNFINFYIVRNIT